MAATPQETVQSPLPPAIERTMQDAPGVLSICWDGLKRAGQIALNGAIAGALIGLFAGLTPNGGQGVIDSVNSMFGGLNFGLTGVPGAVLSGAAGGALSGAIIGMPLGCVRGVQNMVQFYHNVAMPQALSQGMEQGLQLGAELEHQAMNHQVAAQQHTQQSNQFRNAIQQRDPNYAQQRVNEQATAALNGPQR